jgi:ABC-type antimicrobial peptide transport system permease subunit
VFKFLTFWTTIGTTIYNNWILILLILFFVLVMAMIAYAVANLRVTRRSYRRQSR